MASPDPAAQPPPARVPGVVQPGEGAAGAVPPGRQWRAWAESLPDRRWARSLAPGVAAIARRALPPGASRDAWRGRWLGHALHPLLTDIPIGFWTNASVLDLVGGRRSAPAAQRLVGLGVLSALPTAIAGLADLTAADDRSQVIAAVHATGNGAAVACYAASYVARRRGRRVHGAVLAGLGATVATAAGYLGGHLTQVRKLGDLDDRAAPGTVPAGSAPAGADGRPAGTAEQFPSPSLSQGDQLP